MRHRWFIESQLGSGGAVIPGPFSDLAKTAEAASAVDSVAFTFAAQAIGAANASRLVICTFSARAGTAQTISSVTIGGVVATVHVEARNVTSGSTSAAICSAVVPTGTTADVVITWSGSVARCGITVYTTTLYASATPYATGSDTRANTAGTMAPSLASTQKGFIIACAFSAANVGTPRCYHTSAARINAVAGGAYTIIVDCQDNNASWTGLTEDTDLLEEAGAAPMSAAAAGWTYP